jgi:hypothetical protein
VREYEFGQSVRLSVSFADADGDPTNPTTTTFQYGLRAVNPPPDPTGTSAVFGVDGAVINDSAGRFHYDFVPAVAGNYITRVVGTGTVAAAAVGAFRVKPNPLA